jgi:phosphomevalonate kinase
MTRTVVASAPGKVVLAGEYAVLDGAPAISMAVNRRARAVVADVEGDISQVKAPGYTDEVGRFRTTDGEFCWHNGQSVFGIVDSVWRATEALQDGARLIDLDTSEFIDPECRRKIGIGSSAALTVALCAAVKCSTDIGTIMTVAQRAHSDLQGGAGSGVDIACSLAGGLIDYRMEGASVTALDWPDGLSYRVIWTGVPVCTGDKLSKLNAGISKPSRVRLVSASEGMAKAWQSGDADRIIKEYRGYNDHLHQFSVDHDLGIFDAGHEELWRAASEADLTYKPCGAGGGDVGIVLGTDDAALDSFIDKLATKYALLDCRLSRVGAMIEGSEEQPHE